MPGYKRCSRQTQTPLSPRRVSQTAGRTDRRPRLPQREAGKGMVWAVPWRARLPGQTQHPFAFMDRAAGTGLRLRSPMVPQTSWARAPALLTSVRCPQTNTTHPPHHCPKVGDQLGSPPEEPSPCRPGSPALDAAAPGSHDPWTAPCGAQRSTLRHPASGRALAWQRMWFLQDSHILQVTPGSGKRPPSRLPHPRPGATSLQRCCRGMTAIWDVCGPSTPRAVQGAQLPADKDLLKVLFSFSFCMGC